MNRWTAHILNEFNAELSRFWIVADPDLVLLDEQILSGLHERSFDVLRFQDSVSFRSEYEVRYRAVWNSGDISQVNSLILHLQGSNISELPWDYVSKARIVNLSLADMFPRLSYRVVRSIDIQYLASLFEAHAKYTSQPLGEIQTKEFILTHIFRISPHLISRQEDLWRELFRLHYHDNALPLVLAQHVQKVLSERAIFQELPLDELFLSKSKFIQIVQDSWYRHLEDHNMSGNIKEEPAPQEYRFKVEVPFNHPDIRVIVDTMFLEGTLRPMVVQRLNAALPEWMKVGIVQDPHSMKNLVQEGIKKLLQTLPSPDASYREWLLLSQHLGEIIARFHGLNTECADGVRNFLQSLQNTIDEHLRNWVDKHYANLASLPIVKAPVMVHQIPRFLSMRRNAGEQKIALFVLDGLAVDQWVNIREELTKKGLQFGFEETACFAWLPTLTSVSRQAIFSGLKPREFIDTIETTSKELSHWSSFWQDQGLRGNEILYRKGVKRTNQLEDLREAITNPSVKIAGIVVDTIDEIVHGAVLGKRGVSNQIINWCDSGFLTQTFNMFLENDFHVYLTADHGNVEAIGQGRPKQGVAPELRGERVRVYGTESLLADSALSSKNTFSLNIAGMPENFRLLFAGDRTAFVPENEHVVVHGGISVEELIVPFIKISYLN